MSVIVRKKTLRLPEQAATAVKSQREVAEILGISRTRVMQLEYRALVKVRNAIQFEAAARGISVRDWLFGDD